MSNIIFTKPQTPTPVGAATNKDFALILAPQGTAASAWADGDIHVVNTADGVVGNAKLLGTDGDGVNFVNAFVAEWPGNYFAVAAYTTTGANATEAIIKAQMDALAVFEGRQGSTPSRFIIASHDLAAKALPNSGSVTQTKNPYVTKLEQLCAAENMIGYVSTGQVSQAHDVAWGNQNSAEHIYPIANIGSAESFGRVVGSLIQQADATGFGHGVSQHHLHNHVTVQYPLSTRSSGVDALHIAHVNPVVNGINPNDSILAGGLMNVGTENTVAQYYEALQQIQLVKRTLTVYGQTYIDTNLSATAISQALSNDVNFLIPTDVGSITIDPHAGGQPQPNRRVFDLRIGCYVGASILEFVVSPFAL